MEQHFNTTKNYDESCAHGTALMSQTEECQLCKGDTTEEAACFALFDMAKADENAEKGVKLITLQVPCCQKCRRHYQIIKYVPTIVGALVCIMTIAALSVRGLYEYLAAVFFALPIVTMIAMLCVAIAAASIVKTMLISKFSKTTHLNIANSGIDTEGATEIKTNSSISCPVFSDELLSD